MRIWKEQNRLETQASIHLLVHMEAERVGKRSIHEARPAVHNLFDDRITLPNYLCSSTDAVGGAIHAKEISRHANKVK